MENLAHSTASQSSIIEPMVALLLVATMVAIISHRIRIPYTVLLMLVGIGLSFIGLVPNLELTQGLLMSVFLPALLFEAAIHFPSNELKKYAPTIATLAAPGVILTAIATGLVLAFEVTTFNLHVGMGFMHFLLFGTIIAATDPIAVIALFKQLGVKKKISLILEGESLFNDGTAIVIYTVVLTALTSGVFSFKDGLTLFVTEALFGITLGAICGSLASLALPLMRDPLVNILITTVTAYGSFLLADMLHASGVLATATAGLFLGNMGKKDSMEPAGRMAVVSFWRYVSFFVSSIVFLLIGLKVDLMFLIDHIELIIYATLAVLASRFITVFLPIGFLRKLGQPMNVKTATAIWWGGLRGSLSMVLVLSIPDTIAGKNELIAMTFGVVVISVALQGLTMGPLVRFLNLVEKRSYALSFLYRSIAKLKAIKAQQRAFATVALDEELYEGASIAKKLQADKEAIIAEIKSNEEHPDFMKAKIKRIKDIEEFLLEVEEDSFRESLDKNLITDEDLSDLVRYKS